MRPMRDIIAERESGRRPIRGNPDLPEFISGRNLSVEDHLDPWSVATPSLPVLDGFHPVPSRPGTWGRGPFVCRITPSHVLFRYLDDNRQEEDQYEILETYTDSYGWERGDCRNEQCINGAEYDEFIAPFDLPCYHLVN